MRRFLFVIMMVMLAGCGVTRYADGSPDSERAGIILHDYYPQLYEYYIEGVLRVNSLRHVTLADGTTDYEVRYKLVRYYYPTHTARLSAVETYLPELFNLYIHGMVSIGSVWKYVDPSTGRIMHQAKYQWIYNYYPYGPYYGGTYYYGGRRRVRPLPPPRPGMGRFPEARPPHNDRPPQNRPGPGGRPRVQPDQRPQAQPGNTNPPPKPGGNQGTQQRNSQQSRSSVSRSAGSGSSRSSSGSSVSRSSGSSTRSSGSSGSARSSGSSTRSSGGGRR